MRQRIRAFRDELKNTNSTGLFYYAGHGMQVDGENYLIPVNANPQDKESIIDEAVSLGYVLNTIRNAANPANIIIIDACRNNPTRGSLRRALQTKSISGFGFADRKYHKTRTNKLSKNDNIPRGEIIIFSTLPGDFALDSGLQKYNSPFAHAFAKNLTQGDISDVIGRLGMDVVRSTNGAQTPRNEGWIYPKFYFKPPMDTKIKEDFERIKNSAWSNERKQQELLIFEEKYGNTGNAYVGVAREYRDIIGQKQTTRTFTKAENGKSNEVIHDMVEFEPETIDGIDVKKWLRAPGVRLLAVQFYAPCREAVPRWRALHEKYRKDGLRLVVVKSERSITPNPGWDPDEIIDDPEGTIAESFGVKDLPAAFLWDWKGELLEKNVRFDTIESQVERWMKAIPKINVSVSKMVVSSGITKDRLLDYVELSLEQRYKFKVIKTAEDKTEFQNVWRKTFRDNPEPSRSCEGKKELSSNSRLDVSISGKNKQRLYLQLISAEHGCRIRMTSARWNKERPLVSVGEAVHSLFLP